MNVIYVEGRTPIGKLPTRYSNSGFNAVQYWTEVEMCLGGRCAPPGLENRCQIRGEFIFLDD